MGLQISRKKKFNEPETVLLTQMFEDLIKPGAKMKNQEIKKRLTSEAGKPLRKYNISQINTRSRYLRTKMYGNYEE